MKSAFQADRFIYLSFYLLGILLMNTNTGFSLQPMPGAVLHPSVGNVDIPEQVFPNIGFKHELDLNTYPNARCLDGTPGAYYFSPSRNLEQGSQQKFYIFRMGGDCCWTYENCLTRSKGQLGSTKKIYHWEDTMDLAGASNESLTAPHIGFRRDKDHNPLVWDWNHVYMIYCDGGYYAGSNSTPTYVDGNQLFFNGADIQSAVLDDLSKKHGFTYATDLLVGGCSAGGLSTYATVDWVARHPKVPKGARVAGVSCSGFFPEAGDQEFLDRFTFTYHAMNLTGALSAECVEAQEFPHRCVIPEINFKFIRTPFFTWDSMFDDWSLHNEYGMDCSQDERCVDTHKNRVTGAISQFWKESTSSGGFLSGCAHHCENSGHGDVENIKHIDGVEPLQALALWYGSHLVREDKNAQRVWYENAIYPCNKCCPLGARGRSTARFLEPLRF